MLTPSSLAAPIKSRKIKRGKGGEGRGTGCHRLRWLGYYSHPHDIHKPLRVFTIGLTLTTTSRPRSRCSNRFRGQNKSKSPESGSATKDRAREAKCYAKLDRGAACEISRLSLSLSMVESLFFTDFIANARRPPQY
jgi:hypothetical protein